MSGEGNECKRGSGIALAERAETLARTRLRIDNSLEEADASTQGKGSPRWFMDEPPWPEVAGEVFMFRKQM